ncbi:MAG TPA: replication-associated recombination protein A [Dehalococcoidia bacterium]|nr:replication-associated recombination protein A [Dehalococcoidia bacterium]
MQAPLAARMRPSNFNEFVGQEHLVGSGRVLRKCIDADQIPSMILWGPPGSGKTTLANVIASVTKSHFTRISAVSAGVADLRQAIEEAAKRLKSSGQRSILFIDEIHRFSKAQQDAVLPYVENGTVILISATTENPSFEVISPLLSRSRVYTMYALNDDQIETIINRALRDEEKGMGKLNVALSEEAKKFLVNMSNGDARAALNTLEMAAMSTPADKEARRVLNLKTIEESFQHRALLYDKSGDQHYDLISALHKSLRGSDPDASLYWLGRMLEAGEDPLYIVRRMIRFASEDIGMADPQALVIAMAAQQAVHFVGMPEGNLALAQAAVYLATAPKSNALYTAYDAVRKDIDSTRNDPVPLHLRNAPTSLMKNLGYGKDYQYPHDHPDHFVEEKYLPPKLQGKTYYHPSDQGFEKTIRERIKMWWQNRKDKH